MFNAQRISYRTCPSLAKMINLDQSRPWRVSAQRRCLAGAVAVGAALKPGIGAGTDTRGRRERAVGDFLATAEVPPCIGMQPMSIPQSPGATSPALWKRRHLQLSSYAQRYSISHRVQALDIFAVQKLAGGAAAPNVCWHHHIGETALCGRIRLAKPAMAGRGV